MTCLRRLLLAHVIPLADGVAQTQGSRRIKLGLRDLVHIGALTQEIDLAASIAVRYYRGAQNLKVAPAFAPRHAPSLQRIPAFAACLLINSK